MNIDAFFFELKKSIPCVPGVRIYLADYNADDCQAGLGVGMNATLRHFLGDPGPALVLGLEEEPEIVRRGFGRYLGLPCVKYLKLPVSNDELLEAAESVRGTSISRSDLEVVSGEVTHVALLRIDRNVIHRLKGPMIGVVEDSISAIRQELLADGQHQTEKKLKEIAESLRFYSPKFTESIAALLMEVELIRGVGSLETTSTLTTLTNLHRQLCHALDCFNRLTDGIEAWARGDLNSVELRQIAIFGDTVSHIVAAARHTFDELANKVATSYAGN